MVWWPAVVAVVWCGVLLPVQWRADVRQRRLRERYGPLDPPPLLRSPTLGELAVFLAFALYHLPVFLPAVWLVRPRRDLGRRLLSLGIIVVAGGLYSGLSILASRQAELSAAADTGQTMAFRG